MAGVRFAIIEIASTLYSKFDVDEIPKPHDLLQLEYSLMQLAEEVCSDPEINTTDFTTSDVDVVGPSIYLLKLLVRQYGFPCLKHVSQEHKWIVPEGLRTADQVWHI